MDKPDPYGDWVLFEVKEGEGESPGPSDEQLVSAARGVWPRVLAHAKREFRKGVLGSDSASLVAQVWERVLRSVFKTRQRNPDHRPPISDLESYLFGAFVHRFNRALLGEQKRMETIELVSSSMDLERIEGAQDARWVEELERAITIRQITNRMDGWTKKVWQARQYGYSWKEISVWAGLSEQTAKKRFEYGLEKTRQSIVRLLKGAKPKKPG
jgi:DNA-directed RNA polymerase specialized sigma24 family protein